jgi:hypothetical protein
VAGIVALFATNVTRRTLLEKDMDRPGEERQALENLWGQRLHDAQLQYQIAKTECAKAIAEYVEGPKPSPDALLAASEANRIERAALAEYRRVLMIFNDLVLDGKLPEES